MKRACALDTFYFSLFTFYFSLLLFGLFVCNIFGGNEDEDGKGAHTHQQHNVSTRIVQNFEKEAKVNQ